MSKFRFFLHIILILTITVTCISGFELEKKDVEFMPKVEAEQKYSECFYYEATEILKSIGRMCEFYDEYGADSQEVVEGLTVGQLKKEYKNDDTIEKYEDILDNIFYYNTEEIDDMGNYISDDGFFYNSDMVSKYGYKSEVEYKDAEKKYIEIVNFLYKYRDFLEAEYATQFPVTNLQYIVKYTDADGQEIQYTKSDEQFINKNSENYNIQFLYDKANETALMNGLNKEYAGFETLVYKCKTFTDYDDFYALFAVNSTYPYDDVYKYYAEDVITDEREMEKHNRIIVVFAISIIFALIWIVLLAVFTGRKKGEKNVIYKMDHLWWDVSGVALLFIVGVVLFVFEETSILRFVNDRDYTYISIFIIIVAEISVIYILSLIRRIKGKVFLKTSLLGIGIRKCNVMCKRLWNTMTATKKAIVVFAVVLAYLIVVSLLSVVLYSTEELLMAIIWMTVVLGFSTLGFYMCWNFFTEYGEIIEEAKKIANGDITNKISVKIKFKSNRNMADAVNSIGEGISRAVDENVKNERMKTDLITNVSHDIKTPLTSIINYVNLLKMENIDNEKVRDYIRILEDKSSRLKSLTDDLVEASKLSSGVLKLDFNKLNIVQLIRQSAGEFEEKFEEKCLEVVMDLPMVPVYIWGDGRKMWRVLENLYGNIYKYAMKGTRVYVDLNTVNGKILLTIKNISNSSLNFDSNELTERFIRGDVSRSTEGSGLGLSIAKSIIDRHGGEFKIILDGDLFKVQIKLNEYSEAEEDNLDESK